MRDGSHAPRGAAPTVQTPCKHWSQQAVRRECLPQHDLLSSAVLGPWAARLADQQAVEPDSALIVKTPGRAKRVSLARPSAVVTPLLLNTWRINISVHIARTNALLLPK
jgi:hypothetical protein